jgi:hypothetical protein
MSQLLAFVMMGTAVIVGAVIGIVLGSIELCVNAYVAHERLVVNDVV